ncbi:MAG: hypothetical protein V7K32_15680 [Nostoc sp.]|uniref:hypothetical protein n=1 Tax=Nostoc sp. TaxID=1180 RepID=UPI002FFBE474
MTQKPSNDQSGLELLQAIDPKRIADESVRRTVEILLNLVEYVRDRISQSRIIPSLATIIREKSSVNPFGWSWQPE